MEVHFADAGQSYGTAVLLHSLATLISAKGGGDPWLAAVRTVAFNSDLASWLEWLTARVTQVAFWGPFMGSVSWWCWDFQ